MERLTEKITDKRTGEILAYRVKCQKDVEAVQKLGRLEDLEEQGKLLELPCAVGDIVYRISIGAEQPIISLRVLNFKIFNNNLVESFRMECSDEWGGGYIYGKTEIGRCVFLDREEAEAALKELKSREAKK